ncbi:sensor histidine kinase [Flagellimonas pelagia]|uniref:histidine kinase n=1 Tax=Flagellimonas pelagia TaxID=2306998 RepID=A0A3A1NJG6_9FLAO|nr:HAMP domain-containing sensor histidine kinase [Allomuricauda maritima]RIV46025.1 sensor histidine kinase [Allomuricauda maritima]TXJ98791.1 HAMP domain-containing histidine kinase [Allomuricauda maritima]
MNKKIKKIPLIQKTSKTFLWIGLVLMLGSTVVLYYYLRVVLQAEVEEELRSTESRIEKSIEEGGMDYQLPPVAEVVKVDKLDMEILKDTLIYDPSQNELEEFRELSTFSSINGQNYRITVRALVVESENILLAVVLSYLAIILVVFIFLFYLNKSRNQKVWHPFFRNLEQMKSFSLTSETPIELMDSDILEFSELNDEMTTLTNKVRADYKNLKQYTEDVSHEMQTPLAIIQAKIENVINGEMLEDTQYEQLTSIQKDIQRLTQMTKRLTLLTKIENNQFLKKEKLDISRQLKKNIQDFSEISTISIDFEICESIWVDMDSFLAQVLCSNLISNAIKYSTGHKNILVNAQNGKVTIANAGEKAIRHPEMLYSRFYRESDGAKSTGLGLAIVKRICDLYGFTISYHFEAGMHHFTVSFIE